MKLDTFLRLVEQEARANAALIEAIDEGVITLKTWKPGDSRQGPRQPYVTVQVETFPPR